VPAGACRAGMKSADRAAASRGGVRRRTRVRAGEAARDKPDPHRGVRGDPGPFGRLLVAAPHSPPPG